MNYAIIVAGGLGSRVKSINIPKQYYEIDGMAIIMYSLNKMLSINSFDKIYIAVNRGYFDLMNSLIDKNLSEENKNLIRLVCGGKERIDSIHNVLEEIQKEEIGDDDIVVIHDAVRPFVSSKILLDNISGAREYGAVVTAVETTDTMLVIENDEVSSVPNRSTLYREQTPTSANLKKLIEFESKLSDDDREKITGTAEIFTMNNYKIKIVEGSDDNFKITTLEDLERAKQKIKR